ncbi:proline--tRNA ligase [Desulfosudis oleivorans]|uniref:Proline--tRNA ligase n=1 Tax=Desulfosudis oleivorans (strain DSM 6200 / JCM 39069 / Hxd3) TaxID=96561 RepID=A8ZTS9_DESOH|nr:proline--tRNA ligase [Desulfosudis oleivorans]ABW67862.1 prolyl-tRNA synthetase [Desulfosudis oleivorans Hxd3]
MGKQEQAAISPTRAENYSEWYQQVVKAADLAETSPVRGCMVIKPWGYAIWENIRQALDGMFKAAGVKNAYFPLFIPLEFLEREAEHVEGFAKECAVVTHHRLEAKDGRLVPAGELTEPLVVRPTSETIIGESFSRWVKSYRDLPVLINQWANVVRWEMRTRIFLRTSEFLWQEGHTVHADAAEAMELARHMLNLYEKLATDYLAIPVIKGNKSDSERFPGAVETFCIEAMMQDRKALQAGTSHFLGQNFARASKILFQSEQGKEELAWTTSWGVSTRLIGGLIMCHADDDGMIMPPAIAPAHVVLLPIFKKDSDRETVMAYTDTLAARLREKQYMGRPVGVEIDTRDIGGARGWEWIKKGIPLRVEIGPKDIEKQSVFVGRRDMGHREKMSVPTDRFVEDIADTLAAVQHTLYQRALEFRAAHTVTIDDKKAFYDFFTPQNTDMPEIHGGFALSPWCRDPACEAAIKDDLSVTIRCLPHDEALRGADAGSCVCCGKTAKGRAVFAKAY